MRRRFAIPARPRLRGWPAIAAGAVRLAGAARAWHARARADGPGTRVARVRRPRNRPVAGMISASVVICTHNRAAVRGTAVDHALAEARATRRRGAGRRQRLERRHAGPARGGDARRGGLLRVVQEPALGLSAARNRGLAEARGAVVAYLDDDAVPRPGWLARAARALRRLARVGGVGGRIVLRFPGPPPRWLTASLHATFSAYDLGAAPGRLRYRRDDYPFGANISFRAATARAAGGFSTPSARSAGTSSSSTRPTCASVSTRPAGRSATRPDAVVDHLVLPERLTPEWVLRRHRTGGESEAVFVLRNRRLLRALWRVWWRYRAALTRRPYAVREPIDPERFAARVPAAGGARLRGRPAARRATPARARGATSAA